jgi:hypothetical protein
MFPRRRMTPQGTAYLSAYCCDLVRTSGIDLSVGAGDTTLSVGGTSIDLAALLTTIVPGLVAGTPAAVPVTATTTAIDATLNTLAGAVTGLPTCSALDWLAFALQGDTQLAGRLVRLIKGALVSVGCYALLVNPMNSVAR